ncbi:hypothetical protein SynBIOSE41_01402 [Synechococcus sp. BIOS-E4-1]|nr:hypothetical protein SynBIOSE41_01402 [Synechococcus sp. BIOS-E4-1]
MRGRSIVNRRWPLRLPALDHKALMVSDSSFMRTPHDHWRGDTIGRLVPAFPASVMDGVEVAA